MLAACCIAASGALGIAASGALAQGAPAAPKAAAAAPAADEQKNDEQKKKEREQARLEAEKVAKAQQQALQAKCQIKPVMSDEDIQNCRVAYPVK